MLAPTVLATLLAGLASAANPQRRFAVLRHYGDGPLMNCRIDPIVQPGGPSQHVHTFFGANNIGFNTTGEDLKKSTCTTALPKADLSAYWFPRLYFKDPTTNKLEPVPFFYMNVYYFFDATNDDIKAFPLGLSLVSGNAMLRSAPAKTGAANLDPSRGSVSPAQITCPRGNFSPASWPPNSDGSMAGIGDPNNQGSGIGFPFQDCDGYASPMRVDVHFPSCYNPAAGLTNFAANSAFPSDAGSGKLDCPKGWIHVPHMFFESYWDTHKLLPRYKDLIGKESPFVFANGDATGFSAHGDFMSGWDEKALQQIIDNCDAGHEGIHKCPGLIGGVNDESGRCHASCPVSEDIDGPLDKLPGSNPLAGWKYGGGNAPVNPPSPPANPPVNPPAAAPPASSSSAPVSPPKPPTPSSVQATTLVPIIKEIPSPSSSPSSPAAPPPQPTSPPPAATRKVTTVYDTVTVWQTKTVYNDGTTPTASPSSQKEISGYKYAGCYRDDRARVLAGEKLPSLGRVSTTSCVNYCSSKGFVVAGTEYGGECFCGDSLREVEKIAEGECAKMCEGDNNEICGGDWALSLWTKGGVEPAAAAGKVQVLVDLEDVLYNTGKRRDREGKEGGKIGWDIQAL
ncbi:hypothetical protein QBC47DRAFT_463994 [Echria macrotheca]|uniref:WSC domain-containing protein n=1 Tax=Echria macrotheca TaxID=438768 RepID=A0AAJ0B588_9PEZI|nr:hypothetical protein QBC47DRAFT_463994 [Echria macrotheca]